MALQVRPPEDTLLPLSDGDWILVKKWLNAGENNKIFARMVKSMKTGEPGADGKAKPDVEYDIEQMGGLSQAVAYLLDWSAKDPEGRPIVIRDKSPRDVEDALLALPADAYKEITDAIEQHTKRMDAELTARKNEQGKSSESSSTSNICRFLNGYRYEWLDELPPFEYEVLIGMVTREAQELEREPED